MTGRDVLRVMERSGCSRLRQRGSHVIVRCPGGCQTVVPVHSGQDIPSGTLRSIERALEPCLGKGWLR
jgi:predicted RNA binding protein YcfA (HicA-like mRNA interferase family)